VVSAQELIKRAEGGEPLSMSAMVMTDNGELATVTVTVGGNISGEAKLRLLSKTLQGAMPK